MGAVGKKVEALRRSASGGGGSGVGGVVGKGRSLVRNFFFFLIFWLNLIFNL